MKKGLIAGPNGEPCVRGRERDPRDIIVGPGPYFYGQNRPWTKGKAQELKYEMKIAILENQKEKLKKAIKEFLDYFPERQFPPLEKALEESG